MEKKTVKTKKVLPPIKIKKAGRSPRKKKIAAPVAVQKISLGLHSLPGPAGAHKKRKLLGRGSGSGHGKTSTRGSKGQTSRAGRHFYLGFEGGQTPLIRRMPKRGFSGNFAKEYQLVNLKDLSRVTEQAITLELLEQKGLIKNKEKLVKILGSGEIKRPVNIQAHAASKKALQAIQEAGGKVEIVNYV